MLHSFRATLLVIVGTAALAFLVLIAVNAVNSDRVSNQMATIQRSYLPRLELGPRLEADFERMRRSLQDAVAAQDMDALEATAKHKAQLLKELNAVGTALDPALRAGAGDAVERYYTAARDVSRRLIAGETGERLVDAMVAMQREQAHTSELLKRAGAFDPRELSSAFASAASAQSAAARDRLVISAGCLALVVCLSLLFSRGLLRSISILTVGLERFGSGNFSQAIEIPSRGELGRLAAHANHMAHSLRRLNEGRERNDWLKTAQVALSHELRGELAPRDVANRAARYLARYIEAPAAVLYYGRDERKFQLFGHYAASLPEEENSTPTSFRRGEGLVGEAALQEDITIVEDPPDDYFTIRSGLGSSAPRAIAFVPLLHLGRVKGVLELALFRSLSPLHAELLLSVREALTIAIEVACSRETLSGLLDETRGQARRLAAQEEELRAVNEELQAQQEELRQTNDELTKQTGELQTQRRALEEKNVELGEAHGRLEQKAKELSTVSGYKTQFLTSMSHELRTPLNSMLLLSHLLSENETGNLTDKQVDYCRTIHGAGKDLLLLINQVLDLARVESGKQDVQLESVPLASVAEYAERMFGPLARDKQLTFSVETDAGLPATIVSDPRRIEQILNNLLGNAIKFTEKGSVAVRLTAVDSSIRFRREGLNAGQALALSVTDTGVGIPAEDLERVFAPFEQLGTHSDARYGGSGLGLSIARQLAALLGGELQVQSELGRGSTFVCYLPFECAAPALHDVAALLATSDVRPSIAPPSVRDQPVASSSDNAGIAKGDVYLLIVEDDPVFAQFIGDVVHGQGLKYQVASTGHAALALAKQHRPTGIVLDVKLPDIDGFAVMRKLRDDAATASVPVHFVSAVHGGERGMAMGAVGYLTKPVTRLDLVRVVESLVPIVRDRPNRVLIVEDDRDVADSLVQRLQGEAIETHRATSAREALALLSQNRFGCMVLDLMLPDMDGLEFLESLRDQCGVDTPAVVVYTGRALSRDEARRLETHAEAVVLKEGLSTDRVLEEVRAFAGKLRDDAPSRQRFEAAFPTHVRLERRKILVVDDDMRTVYALSSTLRAKGAEIFVADTGAAALEVLASNPEIEIVLMDIMMPEMDGYEAMRRIRAQARFARLPIIALTAKAMKLDREKCLESGASDYLPKPIDPNRLLERIQLHLMTERVDGR